MNKKSILIAGTTSNAGKSAFVTGLCRLLANKGYNVAPFKAQNMSLNAIVTPSNKMDETPGEIGRAQAVQAKACRISASVHMNPVLIKPMGSSYSEIIIQGQSIGKKSIQEYYHNIEQYRKIAHQSFNKLKSHFDWIIMEGAGSPTEINLLDRDITNMSMAEYAEADVILVADIDRGGVFASIYGTIELLPLHWKKRIKGVVINKFRGDPTLLESGIESITQKTGVPILGILPFIPDFNLEEEDSFNLKNNTPQTKPLLDIVIIRLPYISNFTDFNSFHNIPYLQLRYVNNIHDMGSPDFIFIPGSRNVLHDLQFLKDKKIDQYIIKAHQRHIPIMGICGGYQILGDVIFDPDEVEGKIKEQTGLGLIPITTTLTLQKKQQLKVLKNNLFPFFPFDYSIKGYEIHCGNSHSTNGSSMEEYVHPDLPLWGTYLHGFFEELKSTELFCQWLLERKGIPAVPFKNSAEDPIERMAHCIEDNVDLTLFNMEF